MAKKRETYINGSKVEVLPSGAYRVRLDIGKDASGKRRQKSFTNDSIKALTADVEIWLRKKEEGQLPEQREKGMTLNEAMGKYIDTCKVAGRSPSTIVGYLKLQRISFTEIKDKPIKDVTLDDIQSCITFSALIHSPKTVHNEYGFLHRVMSLYRPEMSLAKIVLPTNDNKVDDAKDEVYVPTDEEIMRLLHEAYEDRGLYLALLFGSVLGLRRSEISALDWSDVDFENATIQINKSTVRTWTNDFVLKAPKSKRSKRLLPLPTNLLTVLKMYAQKEGRIVEYTPDAITRRYERLRDSLGMHGRFHDLRHYHCSVMIALNAPELYIMKDMGHSTSRMYKLVYGHVRPDKKRELYSALGSQSDNLISSSTPVQEDEEKE